VIRGGGKKAGCLSLRHNLLMARCLQFRKTLSKRP
jgi:hypothetical protein